jgi:hypothetical protein
MLARAGPYIQPAENEPGLRIAWNNTCWTMVLGRCHGRSSGTGHRERRRDETQMRMTQDRRRARNPRTRASARNHQRRPSINATIRSVRRRADGMMKNAVAAATGQAMKYALAH